MTKKAISGRRAHAAGATITGEVLSEGRLADRDRFAIPQTWTFKDADVAEHFDRHVRVSLPWYDLATGIIVHLVRHYLPERGHVLDLGASTGNVGRALRDVLASRHAGLTAIDNSPEILARYDAPGETMLADLTTIDLSTFRPNVVVAFLVLMFIEPARRAAVIERIKRSVEPGGCAIVFDKRAAEGGEIGTVLYRLTLAAKYEAGATPEEIIAKELSLAGIQRPLFSDELAGFTEVFRFGDFGGWLYARGTS